MDTVRNASVTSAQIRTEVVFQNRWRTLWNNPKLLVIAFFVSFGGFEYGYQQGVLGQSLVMTRFMDNFPSVVKSAAATGWLTSILQLGVTLCSLPAAGSFWDPTSTTYIFFATFLAAGIVWVHFCLPETKGATLEEMDQVFGSRTGAEDAILLAEVRREIGLSMRLDNDAIKATQHDDTDLREGHIPCIPC